MAAYHLLLDDLDGRLAAEAVKDVLRSVERPPAPAQIREAYAVVRARHRPRALEESSSWEPSAEERAENLRRLEELTARIGRAR